MGDNVSTKREVSKIVKKPHVGCTSKVECRGLNYV